MQGFHGRQGLVTRKGKSVANIMRCVVQDFGSSKPHRRNNKDTDENRCRDGVYRRPWDRSRLNLC